MWNTISTFRDRVFSPLMGGSSPDRAPRNVEQHEVKDERYSKRESTRKENNGCLGREDQLVEDSSGGSTEPTEDANHATFHDETPPTTKLPAALKGDIDVSELDKSDEHNVINLRKTWGTAHTQRDRRESDELTKRLGALEEENKRLRREAQEYHRARWEAARETRELRESERKLNQNLKSAQAQDAELRLIIHRQSKELQLLKGEFRRAETDHEVTRQLLDERTTELRAAHTFINQADSLSGADVISMVSSLNAEILQGAALVADSLDFSHGSSQPERELSQALETSARMLGEDMVSALFAGRPHDAADFDPTRVQIALQVCLVNYCLKVIQDWTMNGEEATLLAKIYSKIRNAETQPVAGRWRSMTRAYIKRAEDFDFIRTPLVHALANVLIVAGCSPQDADPITFHGRFQERLSVVVDLTLRLRAAVGENITSADLMPYAFNPRTEFDPNMMTDTYGHERDSGPSHEVDEQVAGTTELGLTSRTKGPAGFVDTVLLKPKVILYSALQEDSGDAY